MRSADHLEHSPAEVVERIGTSSTVAVALPGASLGLGEPWAPGRSLLDAGAIVAIASDWNPGSAPMGDLLTQAALFGAAQKLTTAETLAGISFRGACALGLSDRGRIALGQRADFVAFPCEDYREVLYAQGRLRPAAVWAQGQRVTSMETR